jgi:hypothetical protein
MLASTQNVILTHFFYEYVTNKQYSENTYAYLVAEFLAVSIIL